MKLLNLRKSNSRGDTIVEVLISMSILALVLGAAYATTNRSLRTGTDAGLRSQALSYAQQQVEIIKTIALNNPEKLGDYKWETPFCIHPVSLERITNLNDCKIPIGSPDSSQPFSVSVRYYDPASGSSSPTDPQKTFVVTTEWSSSASAADNQVELHYKPQDNFVTMDPSDIGSAPPTETALSAPNLPTVSLTRNPQVVLSGNGSSITWNISKATSCTPSSNPASATWNSAVIAVASNGTANGSHPTGNLTDNTTFTITCQRTGAGSRPGSTTVGVQKFTANLSASPNPIAHNSSTNINWASQNTTSCTGTGGTGGWAGGGKAASGPQTISNMTATTTFNLNCTGPAGTITSPPVTVTVNVPPAPIASLRVDNSNIGHGGSTTLRWSVSGTASSCAAWGSWGGNPSIAGGAAGTGGLGGPNTYYYYMNCTGPGGTSPTASASVNVSGPPPPPPSCHASAGGWRSGEWVNINGGGSGCDYYLDDVVGWNGGFGDRWYHGPGWFCHTQSGGSHGWGWLSSQQWCG